MIGAVWPRLGDEPGGDRRVSVKVTISFAPTSPRDGAGGVRDGVGRRVVGLRRRAGSKKRLPSAWRMMRSIMRTACERELAGRRLGREHHGVGAAEHGVRPRRWPRRASGAANPPSTAASRSPRSRAFGGCDRSPMICFWMTGTVSGGSSTPRSPRATMTASAARTIDSSRSTALRRLDLGDDRRRPALALADLAQLLHLLGAAHERERDVVDADRQPELEIASCPSR